jgi:WD40 repeat protein
VVRYVGLDKTGEKLLAETEAGVVLWDVTSGQEMGVVGERFPFGSSFCFSNDQRHFATGGAGVVKIGDAKTGKAIRDISQDCCTMNLCFSSDGNWIASGLRGVAMNKYVEVFEVATGRRVSGPGEHSKGLTGAVFLDKDQCLLTTAADGTMKFWHLPGGLELLRLKIADSIYQPTCHVNGSLILWNQRSGPRYFSFK